MKNAGAKRLSKRWHLHVMTHLPVPLAAVGLLLSTAILPGCKQDELYRTRVADPEFLHSALSAYTDVIVYDIFSPPVASRNYLYASIAAYETIRLTDPSEPSLAGKVRDLEPLPPVPEGWQVDFNIAAVQAFAIVARQLIFSEDKITVWMETLHEQYRAAGVPKRALRQSLEYGNLAAQHIIEWSGRDNYKQTRTYPKFEIRNEPGRWEPTPPGYMEGIEPNWRLIRPMLLDSASQFAPPMAIPFDLTEGSAFMTDVKEVYEVVKNLDEEQRAIAEFWDCNPYVSHHKGHVMFATKKITPGGHWMGIAQLAARQAEADMLQTARALAYTAVALFDGFIICWDEKYRSNLLRPETVINRHIDENWMPLLQTPPFPEYTSGHSVISTVAAAVLTALFGDDFSFVDTVEIPYGLPARTFRSFNEAAEEAALSRLYGGIHYMPAIEHGVQQGKLLGEYMASKLFAG